MTRYGHSKLTNIYFTQSCAKRYPNINLLHCTKGLLGQSLVEE
jgi:hypothetical protein